MEVFLIIGLILGIAGSSLIHKHGIKRDFPACAAQIEQRDRQAGLEIPKNWTNK